MPLCQEESKDSRFDLFDDLSKYEKIVVARGLLEILIIQGYVESLPNIGSLGKIVISVDQWHLDILNCFFKNAHIPKGEYEILLENFDQIC